MALKFVLIMMHAELKNWSLRNPRAKQITPREMKRVLIRVKAKTLLKMKMAIMTRRV